MYLDPSAIYKGERHTCISSHLEFLFKKIYILSLLRCQEAAYKNNRKSKTAKKTSLHNIFLTIQRQSTGYVLIVTITQRMTYPVQVSRSHVNCRV